MTLSLLFFFFLSGIVKRSHLTDFFKNSILRVKWRDVWFHPSCLEAGEPPFSEDQLGPGLSQPHEAVVEELK